MTETAIKETVDKPTYILEAERLLNVKEYPGKPANDVIVEIYRDADHPEIKSDEVSWCAAFVGACLWRNGFKRSGSLMGISYKEQADKIGTKLDGPELWCVGVMEYAGFKSWKRHVGFVVDFNDTTVTLLAGNQSNKVSIKQFPRKRFDCFMRPSKQLTNEELAQSSRKIALANNTEQGYTIMGLGGATLVTFVSDIKEFAQDNVGLMVLGLCMMGFIVSRIFKTYTKQDYAEDRYAPRGEK